MRNAVILLLFAVCFMLAACSGVENSGTTATAAEPTPELLPTPTLVPGTEVKWVQCRETPDPTIEVNPYTELQQRWQPFDGSEIYFNPATRIGYSPSQYTIAGNAYPVMANSDGDWAAGKTDSFNNSIRWIRIKFRNTHGQTEHGWIDYKDGMWVCPIPA